MVAIAAASKQLNLINIFFDLQCGAAFVWNKDINTNQNISNYSLTFLGKSKTPALTFLGKAKTPASAWVRFCLEQKTQSRKRFSWRPTLAFFLFHSKLFLIISKELVGKIVTFHESFSFSAFLHCFFPFWFFLLFFLLVGLYPTTVNWMLGGEVANWSLRFLQTFLCPLTMLSIVTLLSAVDLHKTGQIGSRQNSGETEKQFGETFGTENSRKVFTMVGKY